MIDWITFTDTKAQFIDQFGETRGEGFREELGVAAAAKKGQWKVAGTAFASTGGSHLYGNYEQTKCVFHLGPFATKDDQARKQSVDCPIIPLPPAPDRGRAPPSTMTLITHSID